MKSGKKELLWKELADYLPLEYPVLLENVRTSIGALGHKVTKLTKKSVSVVFKDAKKPRRYNLQDLMAAVAAEQELLIEEEKEKARQKDLERNQPKTTSPIIALSQLFTKKHPPEKKIYTEGPVMELLPETISPPKRRKPPDYPML